MKISVSPRIAIFIFAVLSRTFYSCPVCLHVCPSICHTFLIFQKSGFEVAKNLSNMTKLVLLDSLLQEVTTRNLNSNLSNMTMPMFLDSVFQEVTTGAIYVCITLKPLKRLPEDSELVV